MLKKRWTGNALPIEDLKQGYYTKVVDPNIQLTVAGERVKRQLVINNLPGASRFCPLIFITPQLQEYLSLNLKEKARKLTGKVSQNVISRTAAFLLLKDSKASYAIEQ